MNQGRVIFEAERKPWICVLGFASSKKHAPFADDRWTIYGCNDLYNYVPRVDVTFEIHHTMNMGARRNPGHEEALRGGGRRGSQNPPGKPPTPVFMQQEHPEYPTVMALPADEIISAFGKTPLEPLEYTPTVAPGASYFTSSISWMLALAILELTEEKDGRRQAIEGARLAVVGISMAAESEYASQRPAVEHWIGRAQGYGIDVWVPDDAHILKAATLYGYASSDPLRIRLQSDMDDMRKRTIELQQQEAQLSQQLQMVAAELNGLRGQKSYIQTLERNLIIGTEVGVGEQKETVLTGAEAKDDNKLGSGRDAILTLEDGKILEHLLLPTDHQPAEVS